MTTVIKISEYASFTLTREAGNRAYEKIKNYHSAHSQCDNLIIDFQNIDDVSVSFIQATVFRLANEYLKIELKNLNDAIRFKIETLIKITTIDPAIIGRIKNYQFKTV